MRKAILTIRALIFNIGLGVLTFVIGVISLLVWPLSLKTRYSVLIQWATWVMYWTRWMCGIRYEVEGAENIPEGPAIVVSNHQSSWEVIFFQYFLPPQTWVVKRELFRIPFFGWSMKSLHPIAIDRSKRVSALDQLIKQGKWHLEQGRWIIIFPEGTRSRPGQVRKFSSGAAALAKAAGAPLLPVAHNAGHCWPARQLIKYPGTVKVKFGPVIHPGDRPARVINREVQDWIHRAFHELDGREKPVAALVEEKAA